MPYIKKIHRILAFVMLTCVVGLYGGSTMFMHYHKVGAKIVWHSHPFAQNHSHSGDSLNVIGHINNVTFTETVASTFDVFCGDVVTIETAVVERLHEVFEGWHKLLRAPPVL